MIRIPVTFFTSRGEMVRFGDKGTAYLLRRFLGIGMLSPYLP
jgi:hypothetical protein